MAITPPPDLIVQTSEHLLNKVAEDSGNRDAAALLGPGLDGRPPGDLDVAAKAGVLLSDLDASQHEELREQIASRARHQGVVDADARGEEITPPRGSWRDRAIPYELVPMLCLAVVETMALAGPVGTVLNIAADRPERFLLPSVMAVCAAIAAHLFGVRALRAKHAVVPADQDAARHGAWLAAALVVAIGAVGVVARIKAATLASTTIDSVGQSIDPQELAFFVGFQLAFAFGSLSLAFLYHHRIVGLLERRVRSHVAASTAAVAELDDAIAATSERLGDRRQAIVKNVAPAILRYRNVLANEHPDGQAQVAWTHRNVRELADGGYVRRLLIDMHIIGHVDDLDVGSHAAEPETSRPDAPQAEAPQPDAPQAAAPEPEPEAPQPEAPQPEPAPRPSSHDDQEQDLMDAILNPPSAA